MDHGQLIEITGLANADLLRQVVLPRCERRMAEERDLQGTTHVAMRSLIRTVLAWLGRHMMAAGEHLRSSGATNAGQGA